VLYRCLALASLCNAPDIKILSTIGTQSSLASTSQWTHLSVRQMTRFPAILSMENKHVPSRLLSLCLTFLPDLSPLYQVASKSLLRRWITVQWLRYLNKFGLRFIIYLVCVKSSSLVHYILQDIFFLFKHDVHYILLLDLLLSSLLLPLLLSLPPNISHHSSTKVKMDCWQTIKTQNAESATAGCAACILPTRKQRITVFTSKRRQPYGIL
jgi:hypothetical protein